jgi:hypothetical protein
LMKNNNGFINRPIKNRKDFSGWGWHIQSCVVKSCSVWVAKNNIHNTEPGNDELFR